MKKSLLIPVLTVAYGLLPQVNIHAQNVDPFTGGFSYGVPLLVVPSPDGAGVPISAGYSSGIGVEQKSSELGLGWSLNAGGMISRSVMGVPDDWKSKTVSRTDKPEFSDHTGTLNFYVGLGAVGDFYVSKYKTDTAFHFPDYDSYYLSAPGIGGDMLRLNYFDYVGIRLHNDDYLEDARTAFNFSTKKPQFSLAGDFAGGVNSRHYPWGGLPVTQSTPLRLPGDVISGSAKSFEGDGYNDEDYSITYNRNRLLTANFVEYFTNKEIQDHNTGTILISGGFTDFKTAHTRSTVNCDMDGIGAFRVTDVSGTTYHFSLPVYVNSEVNGSYPLKNDYSIPNYGSLVKTSSNGNYRILNNDSLQLEYKQNERYASNWLLTAITGPDYKDVNNNRIVDVQDKGYWVSYDWQLWTKKFLDRDPFYGGAYSFNHDEDNGFDSPVDDIGKLSGKYLSFTIKEIEIYYLNSIKTSSHTAVFVREIRKDNFSGFDNFTRDKVMPQLKLSKIVLLDNKDLGLINTPGAITTTDPLWKLDSTEAATGKIYHEGWYITNKVNIENVSLKTVEFNQDYSLSRKYYNNVNVFVNAASNIISPSSVHNGVTSVHAESGKLTLNKIVVFDEKHTQLLPSFKFNYNQSSIYDNPNYNPQAEDYWGYHKRDISDKGHSSYTTTASADYVDAWSLRTITTPIGGEIIIGYEANEYEKVIKDSIGGGFRGPSRVYAIENITPVDGAFGKDWVFTPEDDVADFWQFANSAPPGTVLNTLIPFTTAPFDCLASEHFLSYGGGTISSPPKISGLSLYSTTLGYYPSDPNDFFMNNFCLPEHFFYTGNGFFNFVLPVGAKVYGGGPRVKSLVAKNGSEDSYVTEYVYEEGVALLEADRFERPGKRKDKFAQLRFHKIRASSDDRHILAPAVGYTKVTVKDKGQAAISNGTTVSKFITSDIGIDNYEPKVILNISTVDHSIVNNYSNPQPDTSYIINVSDKFSRHWGLLKEKEVRDVNNNMISLTRNEYGSTFDGAVVENFNFYTEKNNLHPPGGPITYINNNSISILRNYPVRLNKTTAYKNGIESVTEFSDFDRITGLANRVSVKNPNSSVSETESQSAFRINNYQQMGPKSINYTYRNILNANAEIKSIKDKALSNSNDFSSLSVNTFTSDLITRKFNTVSAAFGNVTDVGSYWISNRTYNWTGTLGSYGLFSAGSLSAFNYLNLSANGSVWRFSSERTLLDVKGHVLETRGFNNRFSASKYGHKNKFLIAEAGNSNYESFTYTGFEDTTHFVANTQIYMDGEVKLNANNEIVESPAMAHTGNFYARVPSGSTGPVYQVKHNGTGANNEDLGLLRGRTYRASVWVHEDSPNNAALYLVLSGSSNVTKFIQKNDVTAVQVGEWILLNLDIDVPAGFTSGSELRVYVMPGTGTAYFDDLRFHPVDAVMNSWVYNVKTGRKTAALDNNNFATVYKYDEAGRIKEVWQEIEGVGLKKIQRKEYNFARGTD